MAWRTAYLKQNNNKNPSQEDITNDVAGNLLIQEWQTLEQAEEKLEGDVMGLEPAALALKENIQGKLVEWRSTYEQEKGFKPTREVMFADPVASELFKQYQAITTMEWPADMQLLLKTKLEKPE